MSEDNTSDSKNRILNEPQKEISLTGVVGSVSGLGLGGYFGHSLAKAFEYSVGTPSYLGSVGILALMGVAFGVLASRWIASQMTIPVYNTAPKSEAQPS